MLGNDHLAAVCQRWIHLLNIHSQLNRRVLARGDTTLAESIHGQHAAAVSHLPPGYLPTSPNWRCRIEDLFRS